MAVNGTSSTDDLKKAPRNAATRTHDRLTEVVCEAKQKQKMGESKIHILCRMGYPDLRGVISQYPALSSCFKLAITTLLCPSACHALLGLTDITGCFRISAAERMISQTQVADICLGLSTDGVCT
ncbi:MAG: hypothetical protein CBD74_11390 [Saprospirales bacterium TMED214]|nr:MAG: hypothetical protein CBD74_11390 [Saprospirales bacterium TMED214]